MAKRIREKMLKMHLKTQNNCQNSFQLARESGVRPLGHPGLFSFTRSPWVAAQHGFGGRGSMWREWGAREVVWRKEQWRWRRQQEQQQQQ